MKKITRHAITLVLLTGWAVFAIQSGNNRSYKCQQEWRTVFNSNTKSAALQVKADQLHDESEIHYPVLMHLLSH